MMRRMLPFLLALKVASATPLDSLNEWTYSLALQAATWGAPAVTMYALRHNDAFGDKARPNTIWRMEDISTPELSKQAGYVTPNVNVIYGFGFMDLRQEPIILEVPDSNGRYYMVEIVDMWTNAFAYAGGRSTGYGGGKFALVPIGWEGELPDNAVRIECPTPWVLLQPRVHIYVDGKIDLPGAQQILRAIKTTGLAEYTGMTAPKTPNYDYPAPRPVNKNLPVSALTYEDPLQFWELLTTVMNENPPQQDQISALLPSYRTLGIELGKPWDRSKISPPILSIMKLAASRIGTILATLPSGKIYRGASFPPATIGNSGADYKTRAVIARIGLTANTSNEAIYWSYYQDSEGKPLTGASNYTMTFKEEIPFYEPGFWSITLYDSQNNYTTPNPINRYMLGSDTDLKKNEDGSFTIYIQKNSPGEDKESNWLPAPAGPFYLIPRCYAPKPEAINILNDPTSWPVPTCKAALH